MRFIPSKYPATPDDYDESNLNHRKILEKLCAYASPCYRIGNVKISKPEKRGVFIYYFVESFSYLKPEFCPGVQGSNENEFWFDDDMEDSSMRSAQL